jgi:ABC-type protease/lipase transport system fused ATPase/permease subunit
LPRSSSSIRCSAGWRLAGGAILICAALLNQLLTGRRVAGAGERAQVAGRFGPPGRDGRRLCDGPGHGRGAPEPLVASAGHGGDAVDAASDWTGSFSSFTRAFRLFLQSAILAVGAWFVLQNELTPAP